MKNIELSMVIPLFIQNKDNKDLQNVIRIYEEYSVEIRNKLHFIFIDDHSPEDIQINSQNLNYSVYRILDNITWNQGGARNLGVTMAKSSKLILTDLDHIFPEKTVAYLLKRKIPTHILKFRRIRAGKKASTHPNTFFCSKSIFFKSLGVDEEFCGNYGYEDIHFYDMQRRLGTCFRKIRRYNILTVKEHSQHNLVRDTSINKSLYLEKKKSIDQGNPFESHSGLFLNFKWKLTQEHLLEENNL